MPALLGWDPFRLVTDLVTWDPYVSMPAFGRVAPIRSVEDAEGYKLSIDVPGVDPGDLDITLEQDTLVIRGHRDDQSFRYAVTVDGVDADHIEADVDKGVLRIWAPKRPERKPRKISLRGLLGGKRQDQLETADAKDAKR